MKKTNKEWLRAIKPLKFASTLEKLIFSLRIRGPASVTEIANGKDKQVWSTLGKLIFSIRIRGPASVTDLGLRYLLGLSETAEDTQLARTPGCFLLEVSFKLGVVAEVFVCI